LNCPLYDEKRKKKVFGGGRENIVVGFFRKGGGNNEFRDLGNEFSVHLGTQEEERTRIDRGEKIAGCSSGERI